MKKYIFPFLVGLAALSLAGAAAFFSVTGLSKLFGGAKTEVIIMASALEFAKIIVASFLHRYWKSLKASMKTYLTIGVLIVMFITSLGIYGFLSNAYAITSSKLQNVDTQIEMVDQKKTIIKSEISRLEENKEMKSNRVKSLTTLRTQQEARVDSLYNRRQINSAKRVELQIEQANKDITFANVEIDTLNNQIQRKYSEISGFDLEVLNLKNNDVKGEVGPLRYIAKLTGRDMDSVVNFFIMLIIFVFDPLAVSLIIAFNIAIEKELGRVSNVPIKKEEPVSEPIIEPVIELVNQEVISEPEKDEESKISYIADETGNFKPVKEEIKANSAQLVILDKIKAQGIMHNASYLSFLDVLFNDGKSSVGDLLPLWDAFLEQLSKKGLISIKYVTENGENKIHVENNKEKEVRDFLTICNLFKITDMSELASKNKAFIAKDYQTSKHIISLLSN